MSAPVDVLAELTEQELLDGEAEARADRASAADALKVCKEHERDGLEIAWAEADRNLRDHRDALARVRGAA